jgi:hypothetical protein
VATQLREHDDREQFMVGIDLILVGITAGWPMQASDDGARVAGSN